MLGRVLRTSAILFAAIGIVSLTATTSFAQAEPDDTNLGGIEIDANGVLTNKIMQGNSQWLNQQRLESAKANLNQDLQTPSKLRKISLTRLEREVEKLVAAGQAIPADMKFLAGMTRITHVFFYPETKDIVIAGPAEGYFINAANHVVGTQTGAATLQLQDLIVALRAFAPGGEKTSLISVSIDPTREGLLRMKDAYAEIQSYASAGRLTPNDSAAIASAFRKSLGLQVITINGVSTKTNFARVMVEADYHMKLIGIGLEKTPVDITSFIEKAKPRTVARSSLQRWYFQPNYDCVEVNEDQTAMELVGSGVKLVGEDESVAKDGEREGQGRMNRASQVFCASFTKNYDKLASQVALWGELRNLIDVSIVAAFIQKMDLYGKADWQMTTFGDESKVPVEITQTPSRVEPIANPIMKGGSLMTPIAGGVSLQPRIALNSDRMTVDTKGKINAVKDGISLDSLADGQWWWD